MSGVLGVMCTSYADMTRKASRGTRLGRTSGRGLDRCGTGAEVEHGCAKSGLHLWPNPATPRLTGSASRAPIGSSQMCELGSPTHRDTDLLFKEASETGSDTPALACRPSGAILEVEQA